MRRARWLGLGLALALAVGGGCSEDDKGPETKGPPFVYPLDEVLRVNHLQVKGTHNSYHLMTEGTTIKEHHYSHAPLGEQLAGQGVRAFELDTRLDAEAGRFKVFHLQFIDEQTTCATLTECLGALAAWSRERPGHHPLFVQIEPKDLPPSDAEPYFKLLEDEITSVWPRERIVTPDDVRGSAPTLREAVLGAGWPTLGQARGKILFFVDNDGLFRDLYSRQLTSLDGRLMFVDAPEPSPCAAVRIMNDPVGGRADVEAAVKAGFLVRTRADSDVGEASANETAKREAALASGAQIISTDFPAPVPSTPYWVEIPGGTPSRCNPLIAPAGCTPEAVEDPRFVR